jgi:hypothetical protein
MITTVQYLTYYLTKDGYKINIDDEYVTQYRKDRKIINYYPENDSIELRYIVNENEKSNTITLNRAWVDEDIEDGFSYLATIGNS